MGLRTAISAGIVLTVARSLIATPLPAQQIIVGEPKVERLW